MFGFQMIITDPDGTNLDMVQPEKGKEEANSEVKFFESDDNLHVMDL